MEVGQLDPDVRHQPELVLAPGDRVAQEADGVDVAGEDVVLGRGLLDPLGVLLRLELLEPDHVDVVALDELHGPLHAHARRRRTPSWCHRGGVVVAEDVERARRGTTSCRRRGRPPGPGWRPSGRTRRSFLSEPATASAVPPSSVPSTRAAMDQRRRPIPRRACRTTVGKPVMMVILRGSRVSRKQCALTDAKSTTAPRVTVFTIRAEATGHHASPSLTVGNPRRLAAVQILWAARGTLGA